MTMVRSVPASNVQNVTFNFPGGGANGLAPFAFPETLAVQPERKPFWRRLLRNIWLMLCNVLYALLFGYEPPKQLPTPQSR